MSTQNPNPPRPRRRIAGERKGQRGAAPEQPAGEPTDQPTAQPSLRKADPPPPPPEPAPDGTAGPEPRPVPWPVMAGLGFLAMVLVLLAAGPFVDGLGWRDYRTVAAQGEIDAARRTAPASAERAAVAILAYDYETLEADRNAAAEFMTAKYRKEYLDTFDGLVLKLAAKQKAHVEASVRASGVAAAGADRVEVLLFVNQTTTSLANSGEPQTALNRVVFSMVRQGDTWRVDGIKPL